VSSGRCKQLETVRFECVVVVTSLSPGAVSSRSCSATVAKAGRLEALLGNRTQRNYSGVIPLINRCSTEASTLPIVHG
jgi:hypothetical protein